MEKGKEEKRKCRTLIKCRCLLGLRRWKEEEEGEGEGEKYRLAKCALLVQEGRGRGGREWQVWTAHGHTPFVPFCKQSMPRAVFSSATCCDLTSASVLIGWSPEFSASAIGMDSRASANARIAYCSMVEIYGMGGKNGMGNGNVKSK